MRTNLTAMILIVLGIIHQPNYKGINLLMELDGGTISAEGSTLICTTSPNESKLKIIVSGEEGKSFSFISVTEDNVIEKIQKSKVFNFKDADPGIRIIYHVSYEKKDFNASEGMDFGDISGTFALSNPLEVTLGNPDPPSIILEDGKTETTLCLGSEDAILLDVQIQGEAPETMAWLITDKKGEILNVPEGPPFDFSEAEEGDCYIYLLSSIGEVSGLEIGSRIKKIEGCHALSNEILVHREAPEGGVLEGDTLFFCVGNKSPDKIHGNDVRLNGESKSKGSWVITDTSGIILSLPKNPHQPDFDDWDAGICLLWYLATAGEVSGLELGANVEDLEGCFDFSNSIAIVKTLADGGHLENGIVKACVEEGEGLFLNEDDFTLTDTAGTYFAWVVTERNKTIVGFGDSLSNIDLSETGLDKFFVYFLAYGDDMEGLEIGNRINDLTGCFDFSNQVPVNVSQPVAGELTGTATIVCGAEDGGLILDTTNLSLSGAEGGKSAWIIADDEGNIIAIGQDIGELNLENIDSSSFTLYHITYTNPILGLEEGGNLDDIDGCFDLSDGIGIEIDSVEASTLEGGPFTLCIDEGDAFIEPGSISLTMGVGDTSGWIITDVEGIILGLPESPDSVDFSEAGPGVCYIWHITYNTGLSGLEVGNNMEDLSGCYALSNGIEVVRDSPDGGLIEGGPFGFCSDSLEFADLVEGSITLSDNTGSNSQWVITDTSGNILALPASPYEVDYVSLGSGECLIWHLSYAEGLEGLSVGNNVSALAVCFDFSNSISVTKEQSSGGELSGGPFSFCVGDGIADTIPSELITLTGNTGDTSVWVITDTAGVILALPDSIEDVNFEEAEPGVCLIWHLTFTEIEGLDVGNAVSEVSGCYDFSNSLEVIRAYPDGGMLDGGPFEFCVGDGQVDTIGSEEILLLNNQGSFNQWVITDTSGVILGLPAEISDADFDGAGEGLCLVWNLAYEDAVEGLTIDSLVTGMTGCYDFSDSILVNRILVDGGSITLDSIATDTTFCTDDGLPDEIEAVLIGESGDSSTWVLVDIEGNIVSISDSGGFNFEGMEAGIVEVRHISYNDTLEGLEIDSSLTNLVGCFSISNAIAITKLTGEDCTTGLVEANNLTMRALQNPVSEQANITIYSEQSMGIGLLTVRSIEGQIVMSKPIRMVDDLSQQINLDLYSLREGMYFVTVKFPGGMETVKIIKQ